MSTCRGHIFGRNSPADRAYDRFVICTRYARYFALFSVNLFGSPVRWRSTMLPYSSKPCAVFQERATPSPPNEKKHRQGSPSVHPKRWPVHPRRWPVHPNLSPTMFEGLGGEIRWHLRSRHRGPKGRSGDSWALLRWLEEGGATGRRRWRS